MGPSIAVSFNPQALLDYRFSDIKQSYVEKDAILYALGLGLGANPLDEEELAYLIETRLKVLPTFSVTLSTPGMWIKNPEFGVNFTKLVHSAQATQFHSPLKTFANVISTPYVKAIYDRGPERGALCIIERDILDADDGTKYSTVTQTLMLREDGGFGGEIPPQSKKVVMPGRPADKNLCIETSTRQALIYRLCGDWNPLHAEPEVAKKAGFSKPILQGLASYGIAGWALIKSGAKDLSSLSCRFCGVVMPGDKLDFFIWKTDKSYLFEAYVGDRRVLDQGLADYK